MAGYASNPPLTPLLLQGTSAINFKAAVPGSVGALKDTLLYGYHILPNATAVTLTLAGFLDSTGAAASIVFTGSTSADDGPFIFPSPLLNWGGAFSAQPSVAAKVWIYLAPYLGGPA